MGFALIFSAAKIPDTGLDEINWRDAGSGSDAPHGGLAPVRRYTWQNGHGS
jgi:hypothetical protein